MTCIALAWNANTCVEIQARILTPKRHTVPELRELTRPLLLMKWKVVTDEEGRKQLRLKWRCEQQ